MPEEKVVDYWVKYVFPFIFYNSILPWINESIKTNIQREGRGDDSSSQLSSTDIVKVRAMLPIHWTPYHDDVRILEENLHAFLTSGQMEVYC
jgi:hypothetical protein